MDMTENRPSALAADGIGATVLSCFVAGRPAPKGSLEHKGGGYLADDNRNTGPWRAAMSETFRREVCTLAAVRPGERRQRALPREGYPVKAPVGVRVRYLFHRPETTEQIVPANIRTGDLDKLLRNTLDATFYEPKTGKGAPILADDSLVCDIDAKARYVPPKMAQGAFVVVYLIDLEFEQAAYERLEAIAL